MELTLTTRKIMFGTLLVLVLAFSTQGIADAQDTPAVDVPPSVSGAAGGTTTLTVTAPATSTVTAGRLGDTFPVFSQSGTTYTSILTLPNAAGNYDFTVFINNTAYPVGVIVFAAAEESGGRLTVRVDPFDGAPGSKATVTFTALGADNQPAFVTVNLSATGGTLSRSSELTGIAVTLTRGNTLGNENYVTASADGYPSARARFLISGMPTPTPTPRSAGAAADLAIYSGNNQSGSLNVPLAEPFIVEVVDAHGSPIEDVRVRFRVPQGSGRFSPRTPRTDAEGLAETTFTPISAGRIRVEATVGGVDKTVAFTVSVEEAPEAADPVISSTRIDPQIRVAAANRPPMLWVDGGAIYGLVGANAQRFAPSVENAMNIAVDVSSGKVYWTEQTGASSGTINSANLDGTSVTELTSILSVPMGIAVDTAGRKVYWTASSGKIKQANLNGSGSETVLQDLSGPTDIVVSNGFIYWTEGGNSIRRVSMSGQKIVQDIAANLGTVGGLAVGGGKVYWTEQASASTGTVNGANLDGTNFGTLASTLSVPMGIAVDTVGNKVYWTASSGKVKRANLDGSRSEKVVDGLGSPGEIVLSNSITAPMTTTPTTVSYAKYDVNKDGRVDNTDAGLVIDALGTSNTRYDVNGDGAVNFLDVVLVFDNRDDNVAGAPTLFGMKLSAAQIDIIQEQIDLLIATNDRSPAALRTLIYMQQLLATETRPEKTQLFANYPNPFNPETWIPYELATDTHVRITIYNTQGAVIRTLQFGHQSAGYYTGRDRAAYWDGRNEIGETGCEWTLFLSARNRYDVVDCGRWLF